jgi:hypothetical protein
MDNRNYTENSDIIPIKIIDTATNLNVVAETTLPINKYGNQIAYETPIVADLYNKRGYILPAVRTVLNNEIINFDLYNTKEGKLTIDARDEGNQNKSSNWFGLPLWDIIELQYTPKNMAAIIEVGLITVSQSKNIISTPVQGLNGSVKEYVSDNDYVITIQAMIVGEAADYYPQDRMKTLREILNINDTINVYSTILNKVFGINQLVINSYEAVQKEEGMRNVQMINISCMSDTPDIYKIIMQA